MTNALPAGPRLISLGLLLTALSQSPLANAQCAPDPTLDGGTVTCAGNDPDGFSSAANNITVDVTGAVASAPGFPALDLSGTAATVQMTGASTITPGTNAAGIRLQADDGMVSIGSNASITINGAAGGTAGIVLQADNAQITIDGSINGSGLLGAGVINLGTNNNQVTLNQTGSVTTTGDDSRGISLQSSNAVITIAGTVTTSGGQTTGDAAHALIVGDSNFATTGGVINLLSTARVTTSASGAGAVLGGGESVAVDIAAGAVVTTNGEEGPLNGFPSFGVGINADNSVGNNDGTINANATTGSIGALIGGNNTVFNNNASGAITGGGIFPGVQLAFAFLGEGGVIETLNNRGTITGSVAAFEDANTVVNNIGGTISGNVFLGAGDDLVNAQTSVGGDVRLDEGSDELIMANATVVAGGLDGGDDTEVADGWIDVLRIQGGVRTVNAGTMENWEIIQLTNTTLGLDTPTFTVGADPGTDPNTGLNYGITLDANSALEFLQPVSFVGNITNEAAIQLTGDGNADSRLNLGGNYVGNSGVIALDVVLGDDSSAADRLVFSSGTITGLTRLAITNLGGMGAATVGDGILVVETTGGAVSNPDAFELASPVIAGGFEYTLGFGGASDPGDGNWYLRSTPVPLEIRPVPTIPPFLLGVCCMLLGLIGLAKLPRQ